MKLQKNHVVALARGRIYRPRADTSARWKSLPQPGGTTRSREDVDLPRFARRSLAQRSTLLDRRPVPSPTLSASAALLSRPERKSQNNVFAVSGPNPDSQCH
jgi:hypothetical protein